ncbi:hypothetical protein GCM10023221_36230 [Luteimicrobium xylanilyticum]|uniref:DUF4439 domain-containing protein n=1 Tax=Luteimicrobium xylanilyticum TaxID=1133546 RepID=A0A5P9Q9H0_9MICO|nr:DUF4439 domain-containing protein [Luteimicrobium xylanilyticum]QFU97916.1 hypothetical protein KDY119_01422 [Luteimicrobium xylanilyticum]
MQPHPSPARALPRRPPAFLAAAAAVLLALVLSGCGVRLESDPPPPLTPTADELVRAATVADVVGVRDLARAALDDGATGAVATRLRAIVKQAGTQVTALGGVYDGPAPTTSPTASARATATATTTTTKPTAAAVVRRLGAASSAARGRLADADDAHLARLVAQVGTSQDLSARALAAVAHVKAPATQAARVTVPATLPEGARATVAATVIEDEDAAGYLLEVVAARSSGAARKETAARAAVHRARAQDWATAAGVAGTDGDPRRTAYALPAKSVARTVESRLTTGYAALLDTLDPKGRAAVADLLADSARAAVDAGAAITALPGGTPK